MDEQSQMTASSPSKQKKSVAWIISAIIILAIIIAVSVWQNAKTPFKEESADTNEIGDVPTDSLEDTTPVINEEIDSININDLEQEFKNLDKDIENL